MKTKTLISGIIIAVCACAPAFASCGGGHTHSGNQLGRNDEQHWKMCDDCRGYYDEEAHDTADGACSVCGFVTNYTKGLELTYLYEGGYAVTGLGTADAEQIVIPSYYETEPVLAIASGAFANKTKLTGVVIPDTVTRIDDRVFEGCTALESVAFGARIEQLGSAVFKNCGALKQMVLPQGITQIGDHLFEGCSALKRVTVPDSVEKGYQSFIFCEALEEVKISENSALRTIEDSAFYDCQKLTSFYFPQGFQEIGESAFNKCFSLDNIVLPDSLLEVNGFYDCTSLTSVKLGNATQIIGDGAFSGCVSLLEIYIPASLQVIERFAFAGCGGLDDIYFAGTEADWDAVEKGEFWNEREEGAPTLHFNAVRN